MSCVFSRFFKNSFPFLLKRYSNHVFVKPEVHNVSEEVQKISTLFVPSRYGAEIYQIVKPVIDIDFITNNLENIKLSCDRRGIQIDFNYLLEVAKQWISAKQSFQAAIEKDQGFISEIHRLNLLGYTDQVEAVQKKRDEFVETITSEKMKLHDIEDVIMPIFQKIPHELHPNTPSKFNVVDVCVELQSLAESTKSHTEIAKDLTFTEYNNSYTSYFLTGILSKLDFAIQMYFSDKLSEFGFFPLAGMDFCKSFIIEAIGKDPYSHDDSILIKEKRNCEIGQKLYLVGGASFESLCAYLVNMNVGKTTLPFKYFSLGRRYNAANRSSDSQDLFSVVQSTNVHSLILSESPSSMNYFDSLLQVVTYCYSELNIPFRVVNVSAKNLTIAESHKKQLELWSPSLKDYVPIAYVSQHDDFVSKRLQITYGIQHVKEGYCSIVEGTVVNVSVLIGCIIENFLMKDHFNVPTVLEKYIFSK